MCKDDELYVQAIKTLGYHQGLLLIDQSDDKDVPTNKIGELGASHPVYGERIRANEEFLLEVAKKFNVAVEQVNFDAAMEQLSFVEEYMDVVDNSDDEEDYFEDDNSDDEEDYFEDD